MIAWIGQQAQLQTSFSACIGAFSMLMLMALATVPLTLRRVPGDHLGYRVGRQGAGGREPYGSSIL